jgi:hypothetical protein
LLLEIVCLLFREIPDGRIFTKKSKFTFTPILQQQSYYSSIVITLKTNALVIDKQLVSDKHNK